MKEKIEGTGGGFRYVTLGEPLFFNEDGQLRGEVKFAELAAHVFFTETGEPVSEGGEWEAFTADWGLPSRTYSLLFNGSSGGQEARRRECVDGRGAGGVAGA